MQNDGLIVLPPPAHSRGGAAKPIAFTTASDPREPITGSRRDLGDLRLELVVAWRELIARYHYLGYTPLTGARMYYLIYDDSRLGLAIEQVRTS